MLHSFALSCVQVAKTKAPPKKGLRFGELWLGWCDWSGHTAQVCFFFRRSYWNAIHFVCSSYSDVYRCLKMFKASACWCRVAGHSMPIKRPVMHIYPTPPTPQAIGHNCPVFPPESPLLGPKESTFVSPPSHHFSSGSVSSPSSPGSLPNRVPEAQRLRTECRAPKGW